MSRDITASQLRGEVDDEEDGMEAAGLCRFPQYYNRINISYCDVVLKFIVA